MEEAAQENPPESSEFVASVPEEAFSEQLQQLEQASDRARERLQQRPRKRPYLQLPRRSSSSFDEQLAAGLPLLSAAEALVRFPRCTTVNASRVQRAGEGDADRGGFLLAWASNKGVRYRPVARIRDSRPLKLAMVAVVTEQPAVTSREPPPLAQPAAPLAQALARVRLHVESKLAEQSLQHAQQRQRLQRSQEAQLQQLSQRQQAALQQLQPPPGRTPSKHLVESQRRLRRQQVSDMEQLQQAQAAEREQQCLRQEQQKKKLLLLLRHQSTRGPPPAAPDAHTESTPPSAGVARPGDEARSGKGDAEESIKLEVEEPVKEETLDELPIEEIDEKKIKKEEADT